MRWLAMAPTRCGLDDAALQAQLDRYRRIGPGAIVHPNRPRRLELTIAADVPDRVIEELVAVETALSPR